MIFLTAVRVTSLTSSYKNVTHSHGRLLKVPHHQPKHITLLSQHGIYSLIFTPHISADLFQPLVHVDQTVWDCSEQKAEVMSCDTSVPAGRRHRGTWEVESACLVGLVVTSLWDEGGEEGADEGPCRGEEARLIERRSFLYPFLRASSSTVLTAVIIFHAFIHQTLLKSGDMTVGHNKTV